MNMIVCIKQVIDPEAPPASFKIDPSGKKIVPPPGIPPVISLFDENAIEAALRIKDARGGKITAISLGANLLRDVIKKPLSMGVDELILLEDETFADVIGISTKPAITALKPSGLADDTRWYWRVRGVDDQNAEGEPSPSRNFIYNTRNDAPGAIETLIEPEDGAEIAKVKLSWNAATDKDITDPDNSLIYRVEFSQNRQFSGSVISNETKPRVTTLPPDNIADNAEWFWRVRAVDDEGSAGPVSTVMSFVSNSGNDAPNIVGRLSSPSNGSEVTSVSLRWDAATDPDLSDTPASLKYQIEISSKENFGVGSVNLSADAGVTTLDPSGLSDNTEYYWRVRAVDDDGTAGEFSNAGSFIYNTANDAPSAFKLSEPAKSAQVTGSSVTLKWTKATDVDPGDEIRYTVHLAKDAAFTSGTSTFSDIDKTEFQLGGTQLGSGGVFYWKVSASDGKGGTSWGSGSDSSPWSFEVQTAAQPTPGR